MAGDDELPARPMPILLKHLIESKQKTRMDRADFGVAERLRPRIEVAAPILESRRTAKHKHITTLDDLDAPAYLVAVFAVIETVPRDRRQTRIGVNADAQIGDVLV